MNSSFRGNRRTASLGALSIVLGAAASAAMAQSPPPAPPEGRTPEARSLLGLELYAAAPGSRAEAEKQLADAVAARDSDPGNLEKQIWVGRREGYLWKMREAIATFTAGLRAHPDSAALYRHRGHRYISVRDFDAAIADLRRAAELIANKPDEIEPDGQPNKLNKPLSTLGFNVWYHLGLAYYLKGDFPAALASYDHCMKFSQDYADKRVATAYWMYLTYRRLNNAAEAQKLAASITPDLEIIENEAYRSLLLLFNGTKTVEDLLAAEKKAPTDAATIAYGVGMWQLLNGDESQAVARFESAVAGENWPAFGFIASEVELARRKARSERP